MGIEKDNIIINPMKFVPLRVVNKYFLAVGSSDW
jgi:hypothetical protein